MARKMPVTPANSFVRYQFEKILRPGTNIPPAPMPINALPTAAIGILRATPNRMVPAPAIRVKIVMTRRGPIVSDNMPTGG